MLRFLFIGPDACRSNLLTLVKSRFSKVVISTTDDLDDGLSLLEHDRLIDLILVDVDPSGARAIETLKPFCASHPGIRFVALSDQDQRESVFSGLGSGLHGFISKRQSNEEVVAALKVILSGGIYVPWSSVKEPGSIAQPLRSDARDVDPRLTPRQEQVLRLLSQGMSNKEIARALRIAEFDDKNSYIHADACAGRAQPHRGRVQGWKASECNGQFARRGRYREICGANVITNTTQDSNC